MRNSRPPGDVTPPVTSVSETHTRGSELVDAFRAGDAAAFEEIVRLHRKRLFGVALRRTGNSVVAEDAVQVALTNAWQHLGELQGRVDLSAWLTAVVHNAALDLVRRDRRQTRLAQRAHDADPARQERRGTERRATPAGVGIEREELGSVLLAGIRALPEPYRIALDLFHVQGLTVEVIAETLGLNENTVKSHLARGRGILRRRLGGALERGGWL